MSLTPQNTYPTPNAIYAPTINLGMTFDADGKPHGLIRQLTLAAAYVDADGAWHPTGQQKTVVNITFGFDPTTGQPVGLPADVATLAPDLATAWQAIVTVLSGLNGIRKLV